MKQKKFRMLSPELLKYNGIMVGLEDLLIKRFKAYFTNKTISKSSRPTIIPLYFHIYRLTSAPHNSLNY